MVLSKSQHRLEDRIELKNAIASTAPEFPSTQKYNIIVADPPWQYHLRESDKTHRGMTPYSNMDNQAILDLPIQKIADDPCYLFLWTTKDHVHVAFHCLEAWGFDYKNLYPWIKISEKGKLQIGTGHWGRNCHEFLMIGTKGKAPAFSTLGITDQPSLIVAPRTKKHSEKPQIAQDFFERVAVELENHLNKNSSPLIDLIPSEEFKSKVKRIELFAREYRLGWDTWGNEI